MAVAVESYRRFAVPAALHGVAEHAWVARHDGGQQHTEVLLPDGRGLLQVVRGRGGRLVDPLTGADTPDRDGLRGAWTRAVIAEQTGPVARLGVQLHPLGVARLGVLRSAADTWLSLDEVLPPEVAARVGDLLDSRDDDAAVGTVLDALAALPRRTGADLDHLEDALAFIDERRGLVRQTDVAREVATSLGELHRWCTHLLGMSPAQYLSAVRFSTFVRESVGSGPVDPTATVGAVEWFVGAGYPPREVERFSGLPPADLRRLADHLALRVGSTARG